MKRRATVEPALSRPDHRMDRNHLKGQAGNRINAVLAAAGFNFNLLRWLAALLRAFFLAALLVSHSATLTRTPTSG
jgi:IS5 family transposase